MKKNLKRGGGGGKDDNRSSSPIRTKRRRFKGNFDLDQLQMLVRRSPQLYRDDFLRQLEAFRANVELFRLSPNVYLRQFDLLAAFVTKLVHLFREEASKVTKELFSLLHEFSKVMDPKLRNCFVQGLVHLRGKNVMPAMELYPAFIKLASTADKTLRKMLESFIINDAFKSNRRSKDEKLASQLQSLFGSGVQDDNVHISKLSLNVLTKLYSKNTWKNAKTVNLIAEGCFSKNPRTSASAVRFFLGRDEMPGEDIDSDDETGGKKGSKKKVSRTEKQLLLSHRVGRKTHKRQKRLDRARRVLKKEKSRDKRDLLNFSAINLLYDPQSFAEKLYGVLVKSHQQYEIRLNLMSLISRLIGCQQLILLNFYPFMQKYLQPRQRDVTKVLLFVAQASHAFVPPDVIQNVLRTIADNFVTDAHAAEVIAVGLNSIREIILRCPLSLGEDLAGDLIGYRKHRDKVVQLAARSLVQAIRDVNVGILRKKDRGRPTEDTVEKEDGAAPVFGSQSKPKDYIPGTEVLFGDSPDEENAAEISDDDDGWVGVSSEDESSDKNDGEDETGKNEEDDEIGDSISEGDDDDDDASSFDDIDDDDDDDDDDDEKRKKEMQKTVRDVLEKPVEERIEMARSISHTRLLGDDDFERIQQMQMAKTLTAARKHKTTAKTAKQEEEVASDSDDDSDVVDYNGLPNLGDIQRGCGNRKDHDKSSRLATVMKGREGRDKFGGGKKRMNPQASTTNREKQRNKAFLMVRQKVVREKNRKSFQAKQVRLHKALLKVARRK